jgi:hypothetical protein
MMKKFLKNKLSVSSIRKLRNLVQNILEVIPIIIPIGLDLKKLGRIYGTDKASGHFYTDHYTTHLSRFKRKRIKLLEIGIGGFKDPKAGGESLRMWKKYFSKGQIFGLDIIDKSTHEENRIKIFQGSQVDMNFLKKVTDETGELDIIIDDGSHINEHVIETFKFLFPILKDGGVYVVEDVQTSYFEEFGGDSDNLKNPKTMMNFFKGLTDSLNNQ